MENFICAKFEEKGISEINILLNTQQCLQTCFRLELPTWLMQVEAALCERVELLGELSVGKCLKIRKQATQ